LDTLKGKNLQVLIEQASEKISQDIKDCDNTEKINNDLTNQINDLESDLKYYELKLPIDKEINQLKKLLAKQKKKIDYRAEFKKLARDNSITNDIIDAYFDKELNLKKATDAYSKNYDAENAQKVYDNH